MIVATRFNLSKYQQNVSDWVTNGKGHAVIKAVPGSGMPEIEKETIELPYAKLALANLQLEKELDELEREEAEKNIVDSYLINAPVSLSEARETPEIAETDNPPSQSPKHPYGGRKALEDTDKKIKVEAMIDPSIRHALKAFVGLQSEDSEAEIIEHLILTHPAFSQFFSQSSYEAEYNDRQVRYEAKREAYRNRKKKNK